MSDARPIHSTGVALPRLRLSKRIGRVTFLGYVTLTILGAAGALFPWGHWASTLVQLLHSLGSLFLLAGMATSFILWNLRGASAGVLTIDGQRVTAISGGRTRTFIKEEIASAYLVERGIPTVEIVLADGDLVTVQTVSVDEGHAMVADLGFGPRGASVTIDTADASRRWLHLLVGLGVYWGATILGWPLMFLGMMLADHAAPMAGALSGPIMLFAYPFFRSFMRAPQLTIGEDGITYVAGRKKRFIPRTAIRSVEQQHPMMPLVIHTDEGDIRVQGSALDAAKRASAGRIVYERLVVGQDRTGKRDRAEVFDRQGRSVSEWRSHIQRTLDDPGYRSAGASLDDAALVLQSPTATREQRFGAALALRVAGEPPARIRVAIAASADEELREAIEAATEEAVDDAKVERALMRMRR